MNLRVSHLIRYEYGAEVGFSPQALYLHPRLHANLRLRRFSLNLTPAGKVCWARDIQDNTVAMVYLWDKAPALNIRTEFEVTTVASNPFDFILDESAVSFPFLYRPADELALAEFLASPGDEGVTARAWLAEQAPLTGGPTLAFLIQLNNVLFTRLKFERRDEPGTRTPRETLALGGGAGRDYAALYVTLARSLGLAARHVSGYLFDPLSEAVGIQLQETTTDGTVGSGSALHGWVEVYLPGAGWKAFDPSRGMLCDEHYIPLAAGPAPESVQPVQGSYFNPQRLAPKLHTDVVIEKLAD